MAARKRKRGPAPGSGGRPRAPEAERGETLVVTLYPADRARLRALTERYGLCSESACVREALRTMEAVDRAEWLPEGTVET